MDYLMPSDSRSRLMILHTIITSVLRTGKWPEINFLLHCCDMKNTRFKELIAKMPMVKMIGNSVTLKFES